MGSYTREQLTKWLQTIEIKGGKILDCGGSQMPLNKKRLKVFEPDEYKILDLPCPHQSNKYPDIMGDLNYIMDYQDETMFDYFDIAFMVETSEYLWQPVCALQNIRKLLKKDGLFYSSWHFLYPVHNPKDQDYLRYTPVGVEKLLEETGFKILEHVSRVEQHGMEREIDLLNWYLGQKMRPSKEWLNHNQIGSLICARKI